MSNYTAKNLYTILQHIRKIITKTCVHFPKNLVTFSHSIDIVSLKIFEIPMVCAKKHSICTYVLNFRSISC